MSVVILIWTGRKIPNGQLSGMGILPINQLQQVLIWKESGNPFTNPDSLCFMHSIQRISNDC